MAPRKPQIFLSYASSDRAWADTIAKGISAEGFLVWYAGQHVYPGDNRDLEVGRALKNSRAMIVLLSPQALRSENVSSQIDYALGSSDYAHRLIGVEVEENQDIPWIFRQLIFIKATTPEETVNRLVSAVRKQFKKHPVWGNGAPA